MYLHIQNGNQWYILFFSLKSVLYTNFLQTKHLKFSVYKFDKKYFFLCSLAPSEQEVFSDF